RTVTTGTGSPGFSDVPAFAVWIVFRVYSDQGRYTETTLVFFTHFRTRALRCHHDHRQVRTDLHAFFHDVETVAVAQGCALLHQRHHGVDNVSVLLVRGQVDQQVSLRDQFFVGANSETVVSGVCSGLTFFRYGISS